MLSLDAALGGGPVPRRFARRRLHAPSVLLALGMTALLLTVLMQAPQRVQRALPAPAGLVLALLPPPPAEPRAVERPRERRKAAAPATPAPGALQAVPAALAPALVVPPVTPSKGADEAPSARWPDEAASAPLRLDGSVLRRAARDSAGLARAAQAAAGESRAGASSPQQALGQAIERAGRPDCLGPNAQGSLLTLPKLALDAATGKCR